MQFNKVVIAVDFSAASLAAARWVAMQLAPRAELALVHVVSEPAAPSFVRSHLPSLEEIAAELTPALYGALRGLAGVVGSERATIRLLTGTPANALATFGREFGADLICLGRRRRRRGAARFGDTTAQRLLALTRIPVLVVPTARPTLPARILAAVDDQPGIAADLRAARHVAQSYEAALEVLHVLAPELPRLVSLGLAQSGAASSDTGPSVPYRVPVARSFTHVGGAVDSDGGDGEPVELYISGKARLESLTHDWLASQVRQASERARRVTTHVRIGDPGEQIVKFVHASGADLVLIGRGRDEQTVSASPDTIGIGGALHLGSTSRLVLWAAPCPVLVLPPAPRPALAEPARRSDMRRFHVVTASVPQPTMT
ncbi:MAG: universal stress protein [bacterium]